MLDHDFTPLYASAPPLDAALIFAFVGDDLLLTTGNALPDAISLSGLPVADTDCLIGELAGAQCRLVAWPATIELPQGLIRHNLRQVWGLISEAYFAVASRARVLLAWDRQHRFCGACGAPTAPAAHDATRICSNCKQSARPRLSPAVMVLVHRGDEVLLARSPHFKPGMYTALAGYVEAGESLEDCIHREVMEEVGIRVTNLRWFGSQTWPFPNLLMLAFHADYVDGEITPQPGEIEDVRWFRKGERPEEWPHPGSISYHLIRSFLV